MGPRGLTGAVVVDKLRTVHRAITSYVNILFAETVRAGDDVEKLAVV